jgi:hypothetical protein
MSLQLPFPNRRDLKKFCESQIPFPEQPLAGITSEGIDFVKSILVPNPSHRPSINDILNDDWLLLEEAPLSTDPLNIFNL